MTIASLAVRRGRKLLEAYCASHNTMQQGSGRRLGCRSDGNDLVLLEQVMPRHSATVDAARPVVRMVFDHGEWLLYCSDPAGEWVPYPHLSRADSMERIIEELGQAPLHVHW